MGYYRYDYFHLTSAGLPGASSWMLSVPVLPPVPVGVKVTPSVQAVPGATVPPQVFFWAKSEPIAMLEMTNGALPVFLSLTACSALVEPMRWRPKVI